MLSNCGQDLSAKDRVAMSRGKRKKITRTSWSYWKLSGRKSAIWQFRPWRSTSEVRVSTFFLVKASGKYRFLIQASTDIFFGTAPGQSTLGPFLIHALTVLYLSWVFFFQLSFLPPRPAVIFHPVNVGSHHLLPVWFLQALDLLLICTFKSSHVCLASRSEALCS